MWTWSSRRGSWAALSPPRTPGHRQVFWSPVWMKLKSSLFSPPAAQGVAPSSAPGAGRRPWAKATQRRDAQSLHAAPGMGLSTDMKLERLLSVKVNGTETLWNSESCQRLVFELMKIFKIFKCLMRCWCLRPEVKFTSCAVSSVWRYCPFLSICGIYENNLNKVFGLQSVWQSRPTEVVLHMLCKACSWALV